MHDFCTPNADEMNYKELAEKVRYHKQETEGVRTMCRIVEEYGKERAEEARKIAWSSRNCHRQRAELAKRGRFS